MRGKDWRGSWKWKWNSQIPIRPEVDLVSIGKVEGVRGKVVDDTATSALIIHALNFLST